MTGHKYGLMLIGQRHCGPRVHPQGCPGISGAVGAWSVVGQTTCWSLGNRQTPYVGYFVIASRFSGAARTDGSGTSAVQNFEIELRVPVQGKQGVAQIE